MEKLLYDARIDILRKTLHELPNVVNETLEDGIETIEMVGNTEMQEAYIAGYKQGAGATIAAMLAVLDKLDAKP